MPALKRARSPASPSPAPRRAPPPSTLLELGPPIQLAKSPFSTSDLPSSSPRLRYRDTPSSDDDDESEALSDVEARTLGVLEEGESDEDVDAALAPGPLSPVLDKGKGRFDPARDRDRDRRRRRDAKGKPKPFARRRRAPSGLVLPGRRIVSTESMAAITRCIDSLATSTDDDADEHQVSNVLVVDSGSRSPSPVPRSPSPSDDEPESPLARKSKQAARKRTLTERLKSKRAFEKTKRRWDVDESAESSSSAALRALQDLASKAGYKLVPVSPIPEIPEPVREVPFEPSAVHDTPSKRRRTDTDADDSDVVLLTASDRDEPAAKVKKVTSSPHTGRINKFSLGTAPQIGKRPAEPTRTRRRYAPALPAANTVPRRLKHRAAPQRLPGRDTQNLRRASPTSLLPRREKVRPRLARRPTVLHRPKRPSTVFGWMPAEADPAALPGMVYATFVRSRVATQRARKAILRRYHERSATPSQSESQAVAPTRTRPRAESCSDDEAVEALLPVDVEMADSDAVDAALGSSLPPPPIAGKKRACPASYGEVGARAAMRRSLRVSPGGEVAAFVAHRIEHARQRRVTLADPEGMRRASMKRHLEVKREAEERAVEAAIAALASESWEETPEPEENPEPEAPLPSLSALDNMAPAISEPEPEPSQAAEPAEAEVNELLTDSVQAEREHFRLRRDRLRRRQVDRIEAPVGALRHPSRRLVDRRLPERRVRSSTAPPTRLAGPSRLARASVEPERSTDFVASPQSSPEPEVLVESTEPDIRMEVESIPTTPLDEPIDAPPAYEFPFFPIVCPSPSTPSHRAYLARQRRTPLSPSEEAPAYAPNRYSRRSPSPPPPYNAQTDCAVLVPPVFQLDPERPVSRWPARRVSAGVRIGGERRRVSREVEVLDVAIPAPVREVLFEARVDVGEAGDEGSEEGGEEREGSTLGAIGRWLGLWR